MTVILGDNTGMIICSPSEKSSVLAIVLILNECACGTGNVHAIAIDESFLIVNDV